MKNNREPASVCVCTNSCTVPRGFPPLSFFFCALYFLGFVFLHRHWWSAVGRGLLFELQLAGVWFNRKFEESQRCSWIRTEGDYCNDSREWVCAQVCVGKGVVPCWETVQQPRTHSGRRALPAKHPHRAPLVPIWFWTYLRIRQKTDERKI